MKIKNFKKKAKLWSVTLILIGALISLAGFGMAGFSPKAFEEPNGHRWYQTICSEDGKIFCGVELSDGFYILSIKGK